MRFNSKELLAVATQPSYKFDKEGILCVKEKHDSLFRRNDSKYFCISNSVCTSF